MIQKLISIPDRVYMRDHTKQFFHYCLDKEIPILIVSAGVSNLIQAILKKYELILPNVHLFANRIHWKICDKSPSMDTQETKSEQEVSDHYNEKGFYDENIEVPAECMISHFGPNITSYNKEDTYKILKTEYFDREEILSRKFVIFMGDARTDPHTMKEVKGIEECIFIGFILPHRMKELDVFMECYDVVIATKNASLEFVNDILHAFLNGDHIMTESELKEEEEEFEDDEIDKDKVSELQKIRAKNHPKTFTYSFTNLRPENYQSDDQQFVQRTTNNNLKG